jgi:acyl dehydratase
VTALHDLVGTEVGPGEWLEVTQERIDLFARATDDPQWIHTDPVRAAGGPFGTTVAHGFLTLSLCVPLLYEALPVGGYRLTVNYGVNRVRFPAPLPAGSRIRARFRVESVDEVEGGSQAVVSATVEREGGEKPVCVAELVLRLLGPLEAGAGEG